MALAQISNSLCCCTSIRYVFVLTPARITSTAGFSRKFGAAFATGSPLLIQKPSQRNVAIKATSVSIRCEQSTKDSNSLDVWFGRLAMVSFATVITIEIATGKGLLENVGLTSPLPTLALAVIALVGVLAAVFIFQSASKT